MTEQPGPRIHPAIHPALWLDVGETGGALFRRLYLDGSSPESRLVATFSLPRTRWIGEMCSI